MKTIVQKKWSGTEVRLSLPIDFQAKITELKDLLAIGSRKTINEMHPSAVKQFKSNEAELILLRLQLSNIKVGFWLDMDGFFNYSFTPESERLSLQKKSESINWTRIDEVISQMAHDASVLYPDSAFTSWYNEPVEDTNEDPLLETPRSLMAKVK